MSGLKKLLALQAQKKSPNTTSGTLPPESAVVETESQGTQEQAEVTPPSQPVKPKGLGLNLASASKAVAAAKPKPAPITTPAPEEAGEFSLHDLAAMDASEVSDESPARTMSEFADEIEATAPDRDLPLDLQPEQLAFVESLDGIYGLLHDSEMFGQQVRLIMIELQENREYDKLLSDSDVHVMIAGMRRSMGLARVRKQEKSRSTKTKTNARKTAGVSDANMALLDSLMGGDDD